MKGMGSYFLPIMENSRSIAEPDLKKILLIIKICQLLVYFYRINPKPNKFNGLTKKRLPL